MDMDSHHLLFRRVAGLVFFFALLLAVETAQSAGAGQWFVRGVVEVQVVQNDAANQGKVRNSALPRAQVFLVPASNPNRPVASALSDLGGRFLIETRGKGLFSVCVEAEGFRRSYPDGAFRLTGSVTNLHSNFVTPTTDQRSEKLDYVKVTLQEGELTRSFEPVTGVNTYTTVRLRSQAGTKYEGYVNDFGEYVVPRIPVKANFQLEVNVGTWANLWLREKSFVPPPANDLRRTLAGTHHPQGNRGPKALTNRERRALAEHGVAAHGARERRGWLVAGRVAQSIVCVQGA